MMDAAVAGAAPTAPEHKELNRAYVDSWLAITPDNKVVVYSGKVELGTGVITALAQIAAEELDVPLENIEMVQGDTDLTPDLWYTARSQTVQVVGPQLRKAVATARKALLEMAAKHFGEPLERLVCDRGFISVRGDGSRRASLGELLGGGRFKRKVDPHVALKDPDNYTIVGRPVPRLEIPGIVTGTFSYVHDVRVPGMLHGRIVHPPNTGAVAIDTTVEEIDESSVSDIDGLVRVVRKGNFIGVVAETEWAAIEAGRRLKVRWKSNPNLPEQADIHRLLRNSASAHKVSADEGDLTTGFSLARKTLKATYQWPFQNHNSIGPSCAVADVRDGRATVWSCSQGVHQLRGAIAELLGLPNEQVRVTFVQGSGCYGHNGADDAASDAALLSQVVGRPVRVQWTRADEHGWNPKGPAMVMEVRAGLDGDGRVVAWEHHVWTPPHLCRPDFKARNLLTGDLVYSVTPEGSQMGGDRNARPSYPVPNVRAEVHWIPAERSVLRPSALSSVGAIGNGFAGESMMDELAAAAGQDAVQFRLRHLVDPRAIDVIRAVTEKARWQTRPSPARPAPDARLLSGRGICFLHYANKNAYIAVVAEVEIDRQSGQIRAKRVVVAYDCGLIINPNGLRSQIEGNVIQSVSRTLKEEVKFNRLAVTTLDWESYPILTFPEIPEVEVTLINRPHEPALGAGEPTVALIPAAIANAAFDASGARLRTVPFTPERFIAAMKGSGAQP